MKLLCSLGLIIHVLNSTTFWAPKPDDRSWASVVREQVFQTILWLERLKLPSHLHAMRIENESYGWYARSATLAREGDHVDVNILLV